MTASLQKLRTELNAAMSTAGAGLPAANELCVACVDLVGVDGAAISMVYDGFSHGTFGSSSEMSRRLDEHQFTFGEGPCLDAAAEGKAVLVPDLNSPDEQRWPGFAGAALGEGIHAVFAMPIRLSSACVGALDLFREAPGPLTADQMAGGMLVAELASLPLMDLMASKTVNPAETSEGKQRQVVDLDRIEVYQATGMLMSQLDVGPAEALVRLRAHAISTDQTASEVAWAIVERRLVLERDDRGHNEKRPR
ncbi:MULTISPECIES: GAF and ANTAR domain-containing protein [unclassified Knoellia]|uniref:GAF and ANTAR domain-containing protein n=1 Tax=Knoellia altitudinis TaxID=3404795 RepID=UPI003609E6B1